MIAVSRTYDLDRAHVFHSWSAQGLIDPLPIASAEGSWFTDYSGRRYLDFSSQLVNVNIGYQHPKLVAAIQEQAARMTTVSPAWNGPEISSGKNCCPVSVSAFTPGCCSAFDGASSSAIGL